MADLSELEGMDWDAEATSSSDSATVDWDAEASAQQPPQVNEPALYTNTLGQRRRIPQIDMSRELATTGFMGLARATAAGLRLTTQSKMEHLTKVYGPHAVFRAPDDQIFIIPPEEQKKPPNEQVAVPLNKPGLSKGDIDEIVPMALVAYLTRGAGLQGLAYLKAAKAATGLGRIAPAAKGVGTLFATGAGAAALMQGAGAAVAGKDPVSVGDRVFDLFVGGALETAAPGVGRLAQAGGSAVAGAGKMLVGKTKVMDVLARFTSPERWGIRKFALKGNEPALKEALEINAESGVTLSAGQATMDPSVARVEEFIQTLPFVGNVIGEQKSKTVQAAAEHLDALKDNLLSGKGEGTVAGDIMRAYQSDIDALTGSARNLLDDVAPGRKSHADVGEGAMRQVMEHFEGLKRTRSNATAKGFDDLFQVAQATGEASDIPIPGVLAKIDELALRFSNETATGEAADRVVKKLAAVKKRLIGAKKEERAAEVLAAKKNAKAAARAAAKGKEAKKKAGQEAFEAAGKEIEDAPIDARLGLMRFKNDISAWGKRAYSDELREAGLTRQQIDIVSREMHEAFVGDLSRHADSGEGLSGAAAAKLRDLRDTYKALSQPINAIEKGELFDFASAPERLVFDMMKEPNHAAARRILRTADEIAPESGERLRGSMFRKLFAGALGDDGVIPDPGRLVDIAAKSKGQLDLIFSGDYGRHRGHFNAMVSAAQNVAGNPLRKFRENPDQMFNAIKAGAASMDDLSRFMGYIRRADPEYGDRFVGEYLHRVIERSMPTRSTEFGVDINVPAVGKALKLHQRHLTAALGGNSEAIKSLSAFIKLSSRIGFSSGTGLSPTATRDLMRRLAVGVGGVGAAAVTLGTVDGSSAAEGLATSVASLFAARKLARAFVDPKIMKDYMTTITALHTKGTLAPSRVAEARRAIGNLLLWDHRSTHTDGDN